MRLLSTALAFFIPYASYSQNISFFDLKSIDSEKQFKRVMFENDFTKVSDASSDWYLEYAYRYDKKTESANIWASYRMSGFMTLDLAKNYGGNPHEVYTSILNRVKRECDFFDFVTVFEYEYACYTCHSKFKEFQIGFCRGDEGWDRIRIDGFDFYRILQGG